MEKEKGVLKLGIIIGVLVLVIFGSVFFIKNTGILSSKRKSKLEYNILPADLAIGEASYVSEVAVTKRVTGTAPWDSDSEPGNDENGTNNIVRSFDQVKYTLENTFLLIDSSSDASYKGGVMVIEATLPSSIPDNSVMWDLDSMKSWAEAGEVSSDGRKFTCYYSLSKDKISIPGKQSLVFVLKVLGAPNGLEFKPTFKIWLAGNSEDKKNTNTNFINGTDNNVVVSAAPKLNVALTKNSYTNYRGYYDFEGKDVYKKIPTELSENEEYIRENIRYGRAQGYGITLQLYNDSVSKQLKGIEIPEGPITFDITLGESSKTNDVTTDLTNNPEYTPVIWEYKENTTATTGKNGRNMKLGNNNRTYYAQYAAPYNKGTSRRTYCNDGGTWTIVQDQEKPNVYHVTVENYKFDKDFTFPTQNASDATSYPIRYAKNIGSFSAGYVQVIFRHPNNLEVDAITKYYLETTISIPTTGLAKSITNSVVTEEQNTEDNARSDDIILYPTGGFSKYVAFNTDKNSETITTGANGDDITMARLKTAKNNNIIIVASIATSSSNDDDMESTNTLLKFDDRAFEPLNDADENSGYIRITNNSEGSIGNLKTLYAAKPDGTGWVPTDKNNNLYEMDDTREKDLIYFSSYAELKAAGYKCVGVLFENRNAVISAGAYAYYGIEVKVKDTATIGNTYQAVSDAKAWKLNGEAPNSGVTFSWPTFNSNNETLEQYLVRKTEAQAEYPSGAIEKYNYNGTNSSRPKYIKREYLPDGQFDTETHNSFVSGNSILIVGADLSVSKVITTDKTSEKTNYNIGKNEYDVEYTITPQLSSEVAGINISGVNLLITETLPNGLTYDKSTYDTSKVSMVKNEVDENGITTIQWKIEGVSVNDPNMPTITYTASIAADTPHETPYNTTTVIQEIIPPGGVSLIGNSYVENRTVTVPIIVANMSDYSLIKETSTKVIEKNGEIKFNVSALNKTTEDINADVFKVLDILPYKEDGRGSNFDGNYKVTKIEITSDKNIVTGESCDLKLYTTNNNDVKGKTTKNVNISADGWSGNSLTIDSTNKKCTYTGNISVVAYLVTGKLKANSNLNIEITLKTNGNKAGDIYQNNASAQTNAETAEIVSPRVKSQVVNREIDGTVWLDTDLDGLMDLGEDKLIGIVVKLYDASGTVIKTTTTNDEGYYKFSDLADGTYTVGVDESENYSVTVKGATDVSIANSNEKNSKLNQDTWKTESMGFDPISSATSYLIRNRYINVGLTNKTGVTVNHYDVTNGEENKELMDTFTYDDAIIGEEYEKLSLDYDGYVALDPTSVKIIPVKDETQNVINFYYKKISGGVLEKHIDIITGDILDNEEHKGNIGDDYLIESKTFENYDLVTDKLPENSKGKMQEELIEVKYYYKRKAEVIVKYVDKTTNEDISESIKIDGYVEDEYKTEEKEISGYRFVSVTENKEGKMTKDTITVIYYYEKTEDIPSPQTADNSHLPIWMIIMYGSFIVFVILVRKIYKKHFSEKAL